jgi:cytokinesis protein
MNMLCVFRDKDNFAKPTRSCLISQLSNLILINGIMNVIEDLDLRIHHRSQMESAGLQRIIALCSSFGVSTIDKQLQILQAVLEEDERKFRERMNQDTLRDLANLDDVYNAVRSKTQDTEASRYFLSMMQHLLLIREEGQPLVHYYQLLDSLVTDVVLDKKLGGAEQRLGHSVERIIAQFNEADRSQRAEEEAAEARANALRLKLEKEALEQEIAQGHDGLVGSLKQQVLDLEQKLGVTRETTSKLLGQLETQKLGYEERIAQLEAQIMELFRMLKEVGKGMDHILDNGSLDQKNLVMSLEKHFQRSRTIHILEGKDRLPPRAAAGVDEDSEQKESDTTPKKASPNHGSRHAKFTKESEAPGGRVSQFMDADETAVQEQIQQQLEASVKAVSCPCLPQKSISSSPFQMSVSCVGWISLESSQR